jgi:putative oxygen-independent coproporphyrinogen III oxidase
MTYDLRGDRSSGPLGLYIHWPFCAAKCPYCDFNSHVSERIDHDAWRQAYLRELEYYAGLTQGRAVGSVFFGGGTPSLMQPQTAESVLDAVARYWPLAGNVEITLEANPTSVEIAKFQAFRTAGINRVSIGIQALNDADLKFLGREHSAAEALEALQTARRVFDRHTFDLIYARPGQSAAQWRNELAAALDQANGHMSLYQLTIEEGTPFYMRYKRGEFQIPDQDLAGAMYEETQEIMEGAGMLAYEISNHAAPAQESRHNLVYWNYGDYAGIGPGAHGRLTLAGKKQATRGHRAPDIWLKQVNEKGHGAHPFEEVAPKQRFTEALMMGLRLREGVSLSRLESEAGEEWQNLIDPEKLQALIKEGLLLQENDNLRPTKAGMQRLNGILGYLL